MRSEPRLDLAKIEVSKKPPSAGCSYKLRSADSQTTLSNKQQQPPDFRNQLITLMDNDAISYGLSEGSLSSEVAPGSIARLEGNSKITSLQKLK